MIVPAVRVQYLLEAKFGRGGKILIAESLGVYPKPGDL
jgi:hypothetical protein